jgi:hypothetical protein
MLAIEQCLQQPELGPEAFEIKRSRGATFDGRLIYIRPVYPVDPCAAVVDALCAFVDRRNRAFLADLEPRFAAPKQNAADGVPVVR